MTAFEVLISIVVTVLAAGWTVNEAMNRKRYGELLDLVLNQVSAIEQGAQNADLTASTMLALHRRLETLEKLEAGGTRYVERN